MFPSNKEASLWTAFIAHVEEFGGGVPPTVATVRKRLSAEVKAQLVEFVFSSTNSSFSRACV